MVERCLGQNRDGSPCQAKPRPGSDRCPWHTPALAEQRRAWSRKGGQSRSNKARARKQLPDGTMSAAELGGLLGLVLKGVIAGRVEPGVGNAAANLARAITAVRESGEFEDRLAALEAAAQIGGKTA